MGDKRAYFKLDVGYLTNPKVAAVALERPTAVILHIASIGYSAQHLTDGVFPIPLLLRMYGCEQEDADLLLETGLWYDAGNGKAEIHDYLEHQRSAAETKDATEKAKRAADARWNASSMLNAKRPASETSMPREKEREKDTNNQNDSAFEDFWTRYPRKIARGAAKKAWTSATKKTDVDSILKAARSFAVRSAGADPKFIPHPATWLNGERWADEVDTQKTEAEGTWFQPFNPGEPPRDVADDPEKYAAWLDRKQSWREDGGQ